MWVQGDACERDEIIWSNGSTVSDLENFRLRFVTTQMENNICSTNGLIN